MMNSEPVLNVLSPAIASQAHLLKGLSISRLPSNLLQRLINDSAATGAEYRRVASINSVTQLAPNSSWCGVCVASSCCCIGTLVQDGTMGALRQDNNYLYLAPGYHTFCCFGRELSDPVRAPRVGTYSTFGPRGFANIGEGCIGVLVVGSQYKLLAPGLYEWDSPSVVCDGIVSLSADVVVLGPYRLISVSEGNVAVTFNNGALCILGGGDDTGRRTYFMDDVKWVFSCMLPTVIQTDRLEGNDLLSKDNVEILMVAMSHWRVVDPALAIVNCAPNIEGIRTKTNQLVRATIARIVAGTNIGNGPVSGSVAHPVVQAYAVGDANAPAKPSGNADETDLAHLMQSTQATQHMAQLSAQMSIMGIEVLGVFVPEKRIKNDDIRSQIARQAVIGIRAEAQRAAADATAYATLKGARAQAEAIEMLAAAHSEAGRRLGDPDSTASRLALSENLGKALTDANVTLFSGAPGMLPFMFGNSPAPAAGAKRRANGGSKGSANNNTLGSIMDDQDVDLVAASRETDS